MNAHIFGKVAVVSALCLLVAMAGGLVAPTAAEGAACQLNFAQKFLGTVDRHDPCYSTAVADFNGDGHQDVAVLLASAAQVLIYNGDGHGGFGAATSFAAGSFPEWIAAGDLNRDGKPDLAVANFGLAGSAGVSILLNNGSGGFGAPVLILLGTEGTSQVAMGDFDGNGTMDVVAEDVVDGSTIVLLGNGDGTFAAPVTTNGTGGGPMAVGEFNDDGKLDLAVGAGTQLNILLGNGAGGFALARSYPTGPGDATAVVAADFNGDGQLDLAVSKVNTDSQVVTFLGNGTGRFAPSAPVPFNDAWGLVAADIDGNGTVDLAIASSENNDGVALGNGRGRFGPVMLFPLTRPQGPDPISINTGDFNEDGLADLVNANYGASGATVLLTSCRMR